MKQLLLGVALGRHSNSLRYAYSLEFFDVAPFFLKYSMQAYALVHELKSLIIAFVVHFHTRVLFQFEHLSFSGCKLLHVEI